jgi:hypothetical protein
MKYIVTGQNNDIKAELRGDDTDKLIRALIKIGINNIHIYCMEGEHRSIKCQAKVR